MKNNLLGWKDIFRFTFVQSLKTKSIKIVTIILCAAALLSIPVISAIKGDDGQGEISIKNVFVIDNTGLNLYNEINELKKDKYYENKEENLFTSLNYSVGSSQTKEYEFKNSDKDIYMEISLSGEGNEKSVYINLIYSKDTKVKENDVIKYTEFLQKNFKNIIMNKENLTEEQRNIVNSTTNVKVGDINKLNDEDTDKEADSEKNTDETGGVFGIVYMVSMITMFILAFGGERVAMSIITEKSSKVMEYLMTSVKPMAVVVGKVLASLLVILVQMGSVLLCLFLSILINGVINGSGFIIPSYLKALFQGDSLNGLNPVNAIVALLILLGGFMFYGLIAGLAGAAVSRVDEVSEGLKIYTVILIIGAYLSIFVISGNLYKGELPIKYFSSIFPVSSPFIAPSTLITGDLNLLFGFVSLLVMAISLYILTKFVANVYESMIYYNGNALKIKDIINIAKQNKISYGKSKNGKVEK